MTGNEKAFMRLGLAQRLDQVRVHGEYIGSRGHGGHRVHLYRMDGFFCEVWMRLGWNHVEWIEIARHPDVLEEYVKLDPGDLLRG
jgi:hypothetical protein